jgi:hypothetical protein
MMTERSKIYALLIAVTTHKVPVSFSLGLICNKLTTGIKFLMRGSYIAAAPLGIAIGIIVNKEASEVLN